MAEPLEPLTEIQAVADRLTQQAGSWLDRTDLTLEQRERMVRVKITIVLLSAYESALEEAARLIEANKPTTSNYREGTYLAEVSGDPDMAQRCYADAIRALIPKLSKQEESMWHPIETAPRDVCILTTNGKNLYITNFSDEDDTFRKNLRTIMDDDDNFPVYTHWMPLPKPPSQGEGQ
jgi:hypothetical protein